ncbi:MAG: hypothetical protein ACE5NC_10055, partial [Anaerolineae bacterium]
EIRMPEEWDGIIPTEVFLHEARRIVDEANDRALTLRVLGGVGIRLLTPNHVEVAKRLGRLGEGEQEFTDLDFMSYKKQRKKMKSFFEELGYGKRRATLSTAASERQIYFHPDGWFFVDVFFDKLLVANHPLDLRGRLELASLTLTPADLLLEKVQIVNMGDKDVKDTVVLLLAHDVGNSDEDGEINGQHIAQLLSADWGFWYTVTTNLDGLRDHISEMGGLSQEETGILQDRIGTLLDRLESEPKSFRWKARAQVGPRVRWYEPVETIDTVGGFGIWRVPEERKEAER